MAYALSPEHEKILDQYNEALAADNIDKAMELIKQIPVPPEFAYGVDRAFGPDRLEKLGFTRAEPGVRHA